MMDIISTVPVKFVFRHEGVFIAGNWKKKTKVVGSVVLVPTT